MDPTVPRRIRQLDFSCNSERLEYFLRAFDSNPPSNASSIRLQITPRNALPVPRDHLASFLPFSFPQLSKLDFGNLRPDPSSPLLTTSNLTSLKLCTSDGAGPPYTLAQLSEILQKHPNLRELDLKGATAPQAESREAPVPLVLPQLADLSLCSTSSCILGIINLIDMSSPLHNVVLHFHYPSNHDIPVLVSATKEILAAYYECEGLGHPRKANYLSVVLPRRIDQDHLVITARSCSAPTPSPQPTLELRFDRTDHPLDVLQLFPLIDTQEFIAEGLDLSPTGYHTILQKMGGVSRLELSRLKIGPVLAALKPSNWGTSKRATGTLLWITYTCAGEPAQQFIPKLVSLTLDGLDFLSGVGDLLDVLEERCKHNIGLELLVVSRCRVRGVGGASQFKKLVKEVKWVDVEEMGLNRRGSGGLAWSCFAYGDYHY